MFLENVTCELRVGYCAFTSCLLHTELSFPAFMYVESLLYTVGIQYSDGLLHYTPLSWVIVHCLIRRRFGG